MQQRKKSRDPPLGAGKKREQAKVGIAGLAWRMAQKAM
jgi:hypothetical protein